MDSREETGKDREGMVVRARLTENQLCFDRPFAPAQATFTPLFCTAGFSAAQCALLPESSGAKEQSFVAFTVTEVEAAGMDWDVGEGRRRSGWVRDGDQFLWLPDRLIYGSHEVPIGCLSLMLEPDFLVRVARESIDPDRLELRGQSHLQDPFVAGVAYALRREYERHGTVDPLYGEALATALAVHTLRTYSIEQPSITPLSKRGLGQTDLRRALSYIHQRFETDMSVSDIAASVHLSPHHFARLFRQSTGHSPHQYILRLRVEKAKTLLKTGGLSLGEIAHLTGFVDQSHFHRWFKKMVGVTPRQFRKR